MSDLEELRCKHCSAPLSKVSNICRYCGTVHERKRGFSNDFKGLHMGKEVSGTIHLYDPRYMPWYMR